MGYLLIQVGAGAGDLDSRANCRDGFTEYVKGLDRNQISKIILVEPNPINLPLLRQCWRDYPQAEILQIGIRSSSRNEENIDFYYAEEDAPHFQTCSMSIDHVRKHYPNGTIKKIQVETKTVGEFLDCYKGNKIDLISLDVEGIDAEIILDATWKNVDVDMISFEYIHLGKNFEAVINHLLSSGFNFAGMGVDANNYDLLFKRQNNSDKFATFMSNVKLSMLRMSLRVKSGKIKRFIQRFL